MKRLIAAIATVPMIALGGAGAAQTADGQFNNPEEIRGVIEQIVDERFGDAILMTDRDCDVFGTAWRPYQPIGGRFFVASGQGRDDRGEVRDFPPGDEGGEYRHPLTEPEMPKHAHSYVDHHSGSVRADYGDDEPGERKTTGRETGPAGESEPHNNMPPYLALNFCHIP